MADPAARFQIAFGNDTLDWDVTWISLDDDYPNLITSYTIDRGRQYELDRTDVGRATVEIADKDGVLDPTNPDGPFYGLIEPLLQAAIARRNPINNTWYTRFRGFIEECDYSFDPSQRVNRLTVSLVDLFEVLAAVEMQPGVFGDSPPTVSAGQVFFDNANCDDRILEALGPTAGAGIPADYYVVFSGNVDLHETVYSPGENVLTVIQEAADAEFPGVSNVYVDRIGRLCFHGRFAKFHPEDTSASAGPDQWDFISWKVGDGTAVNADPVGTAHIRQFGFNRGMSKVINQALATPVGVADTAVAAQLVTDTTSIGKYGIRGWTAQNLITRSSLQDSANDLVETKRFASYYVDNYKNPGNRITTLGLRSMRPGQSGATKTWELMSKIDIADEVLVTVGSPGGGGFDSVSYFVEGVHETCSPLNDDMDDVTLTLDLSPRAYFDTDPWS